MSIDYIVSSLPPLVFGEKAPMTWEAFVAAAGEVKMPPRWVDLETQLRNAMASARGGEEFIRPARGCDLYWQDRITQAFQEKDIMKREEFIDRVWWDAAGELTPSSSPLGAGALATYAIRLGIALKRSRIDTGKGGKAFDRLAAETKITL